MQDGSGATVVIVAYRPKPGKEKDLLQLTREHLPLLRAQGLATERAAIVCRARDGTIVEAFEWKDGGAERAHRNPAVLALWARYSGACDIVPLNMLVESGSMFAGFEPVDL